MYVQVDAKEGQQKWATTQAQTCILPVQSADASELTEPQT